MFFTLSKLFWFVVNPGNLLLLALVVGAVLSYRKAGVWLLRICTVAALFFAIVPVGAMINQHLENRFPADPKLPDKVDGIVILGGVLDPALSGERKKPQIGSAVERLIEGAQLAQRYPQAKVIFSGGSGNVFNPETREARFAPPLFAQLGLGDGRVVYDENARNTAENAIYSKALAKPAPGESWILVTSAFHMPRAVGVFRKAGWKVIPYPVDFSFGVNAKPGLMFNLVAGLANLNGALHEIIGLTAYWLTGKTDAWYPAPAQ